MIRWGKNFRLRAQIQEENLHFTRSGDKKEGKKEWKRDGKEKRRTSLPLVGYFPQDREIVEGPPQKRRDFLDRLFFIYPSYNQWLREYENFSRRNFLLRERSSGSLLKYMEKI